MNNTRLEKLREELNKLVSKKDTNLYEGEILTLSQKLDEELNLLSKTYKNISA